MTSQRKRIAEADGTMLTARWERALDVPMDATFWAPGGFLCSLRVGYRVTVPVQIVKRGAGVDVVVVDEREEWMSREMMAQEIAALEGAGVWRDGDGWWMPVEDAKQ